MQSDARRWAAVLGAAAALGALGHLANLATPDELAGDPGWPSFARQLAGHLANSGTAWAGIAVAAGRVLGACRPGHVVGIAACLVALASYDLLGAAIGLVDPADRFGNLSWYAAAGAVGAPLAAIGALGRRRTRLGLAARLVVPAGAMLEPIVRGRLVADLEADWPTAASAVAAGALMLAGGAIWSAAELVRARRRRDRAREKGEAEGMTGIEPA